MAPECDQCGDPANPRHTLNHVSYQGDLFSKMVSRMVVCSDCREDMADSDKWEW